MQLPPDHMPPTGFAAHFAVFCLVWVVLAAALWWFFKRLPRERRNLIVGNVLVFLGLAWTLVTLGEAYFRYVYDATDSYGLTVTNWAWFRRHCSDLNSDGFREVPLGDGGRLFPKKPGTRRVGFLGDSFTFGYGVPEREDLFPQRIGANLQVRAPGAWECWNLGVIGWQTGDQAALLGKLVPVGELDHVVLAYCLNDVEDLMPPGRRFVREEAARPPLLEPWHSFLLDTLWYRMHLRADPRVAGYFEWVQDAYDDRVLMARQTDRFRWIAEHCRRHGVRLDVVVFPFFGVWGPDYPFDAAHDRVAEAWSSLGVRVVDLRSAYRANEAGTLVVNRFDAHPNELAHSIAAFTLLEELFPRR